MAGDAGPLIRRLRNDVGITQRELAARMGTTQSAIAALERPESNPTIATVTAALDALGHELHLGAEPRARNVDESLIRQQLELTPAERLRQVEQMAAQARRLPAAGARARASWTDFRPTRLLGRLVDGEVDFVVVGAIAVILHAQPRFTKDLDIRYATEAQNLERLGAVLAASHARPRGIDQDVPFVADARTLRQVQILTLSTDDGDLDLLVDPAGAPPYPRLRDDAELMDIGTATVRVASISHLAAMKRAAGCPQDLLDVEALEIARRRRGRRPRR